jgi:hypothetical protein
MLLNLIYYSSLCSAARQITILLGEYQITLDAGVTYQICKTLLIL